MNTTKIIAIILGLFLAVQGLGLVARPRDRRHARHRNAQRIVRPGKHNIALLPPKRDLSVERLIVASQQSKDIFAGCSLLSLLQDGDEQDTEFTWDDAHAAEWELLWRQSLEKVRQSFVPAFQSAEIIAEFSGYSLSEIIENGPDIAHKYSFDDRSIGWWDSWRGTSAKKFYAARREYSFAMINFYEAWAYQNIMLYGILRKTKRSYLADQLEKNDYLMRKMFIARLLEA